MILGREYVKLVEKEYTSWDGQKKSGYEYDPDSLLNSINYGNCFVIICGRPDPDKDRQTEQIFIDNLSETISIIKDLFEKDNAVYAAIEYQMTEEQAEDPLFVYNKDNRTFFFSSCQKLAQRRASLSHLIDEDNYKKIPFVDNMEVEQ